MAAPARSCCSFSYNQRKSEYRRRTAVKDWVAIISIGWPMLVAGRTSTRYEVYLCMPSLDVTLDPKPMKNIE
jgi:hypothetical protein